MDRIRGCQWLVAPEENSDTESRTAAETAAGRILPTRAVRASIRRTTEGTKKPAQEFDAAHDSGPSRRRESIISAIALPLPQPLVLSVCVCVAPRDPHFK